MSTITTSTSTMQAALEYATERGWRVIPIPPGQKYPRHKAWQNIATTDTAMIEVWWERDPDHGIGIVCGEVSGLVVIDVDVNDGKVGARTLADLEEKHGPLPETYTVQTPTGGWHHYFRYDPARPTDNSDLGLDVNVRAERGQVLAPPTIHPDTGTPYRVHLDVPLADLPDWFYLEVAATATTAATATSSGTAVGTANYDGLPGTDYNARHTWAELLTADEWTLHHVERDDNGIETVHWTRPKKDPKKGSSATTNYNGDDLLTVFTSSVPELEPKIPYSRFTYYAATQHNGDLTAAYHALLGLGYGNNPDDLSWIPDTAADKPPADLQEVSSPPPARDRFVDGATFILDGPTDVPAIWGDGDQVLWASGEPCIITGPPGVGKTTLVGQIVAGRLGLSIWPVLGLPIVKGRRVLYLASDRPQQIRRSLARQFTGNDRTELADRLTVWTGPPPGDFAKNPKMLAAMCAQADADTVIIDSLKDVAIGLSDDEVGAGLNSAIQEAIANDVEVLALHHQRKGTNGTKPRTLEDVYGSTWITAGAGSVVLLWGTAGDLVVELLHLKQPADTVGPWKIEHDHDRGITTIAEGTFDLLTWLQSQPGRVTTADVAKAITGKTSPTDNDKRQALRKLDKLVEAGHATKIEAVTGGPTGTQPARYQSTKEVA